MDLKEKKTPPLACRSKTVGKRRETKERERESKTWRCVPEARIVKRNPFHSSLFACIISHSLVPIKIFNSFAALKSITLNVWSALSSFTPFASCEFTRFSELATHAKYMFCNNMPLFRYV